MNDTFLSPAEVSDLTDVRTGKNGKTREQLQCEALRQMKIPYLVSAIGRPKVARATIEGRRAEAENTTWEPSFA